MQTGPRAIVVTLIFVVLLGVPCTNAVPRSLEAEVDAYLLPLVNDDLVCGSVLIARHGEVLLAKGYGLANREDSIPNSAATRFRLGSVSKQFTAAAILILEQQGLLSTEDPVSKFYPDYPNGDKITIHHLLTHTSGIINASALPDYGEKMRLPLSTREVVDWFKDEPLRFEPGERFEYSNSGYILAAGIIEQVTGKSYAEFLKDHIFRPLDMNESGQDDEMDVIPHRAHGHYSLGPKVMQAPYRNMPFMAGAGSLYSTVGDLFKWDQALYGTDLLSDASKIKMFTPHAGNYGYGWFIQELNGHRVITHRGGINGFLANIDRFVDDTVLVVTLLNFESTFAPLIRSGLAAIALGEPYSPVLRADPLPVSVDSLNACVGQYELTPEMRIAVENKDGQLYLREPTGDAMPALAQKPNRYFVRGMNAMVWFDFGTDGVATALRGMQGAHGFIARRVEP